MDPKEPTVSSTIASSTAQWNYHQLQRMTNLFDSIRCLWHNLQHISPIDIIEERNRKMKVITNDVDTHEEQGSILHEGCQYKNVKNKCEDKRIKPPLNNEDSKNKKTNVKNSKRVSFKKEWAYCYAHSFWTIQIDK